MKDGREFMGTPTQIVQAMRGLAFASKASLGDYIDHSVKQAESLMDVSMKITGTTDDEKAACLVSEMLRTELAQEISNT